MAQHALIVIDRAIPPGSCLVSAAHAALAWHLRCETEHDRGGAAELWFHREDISLVDTHELDRARAAPRHIVMTESTLGNRQVAVIFAGKEGSPLPAPLPRDPSAATPSGRPLRMYILIKSPLPFEVALCAAANAAVACYRRFARDEHMLRWVNGSFFKAICRVNAAEFARAATVAEHVSVSMPGAPDPVALAFCPRPEWPKMFRFLPLFS